MFSSVTSICCFLPLFTDIANCNKIKGFENFGYFVKLTVWQLLFTTLPNVGISSSCGKIK
jgi:hypothetical protein